MRSMHQLVSLFALSACCLLLTETADAQDETNYVPIEPCRLFDTRATSVMVAGVERGFFVVEILPGDIGDQGGQDGGCGIPSGATAVHINFTAVSAAGSGFMRATAWSSPIPNATLLNYFSQANVSNSTPVPFDIGKFDLKVKVFNNDTDLVGDAVGYYLPVPLVVKELFDEERALEEPAPTFRP